MQKIKPFLWFDRQAEEAVSFYVSVFPGAKIGDVTHYLEGSAGTAGTVMTVEFELFGQGFVALNGGPIFTFSPAISFHVECDTQEEIDAYWAKLLEGGGTEEQCGWLKDKYGVSWQIDAKVLSQYLKDPDPAKAKRVMDAMLKMVKIDIAELDRAYAG